jgi:ketosteroid isomerase-like protein
MPDRTEATRRQVTAFYAAYRAGDMATVMAGMTDDVAWQSICDAPLPWSGAWRGREGVGAYFAALAARFQVIGYDIERIMADGDWATVLATVHVRFHADGSEGAYPKVDVLRLDGDRVAEFREYYDTATVGRDLGQANTGRSG